MHYGNLAEVSLFVSPNFGEVHMSLSCNVCGSSDFRVSSFRSRDLPHLFVLYQPMRCSVCHHRNCQPIMRFFKMVRQTQMGEGELPPFKKA